MTDGAPGQTPHQAEPSCYNCGQKGHWAIGCPEPTREVPAGVEAARAQRQNSAHGSQAGNQQGKSQRRGSRPVITRYPAPLASGPTVTRYPLPPQTQPPYPPGLAPPQYYPPYSAQGQPQYGDYSYPAPGAPYGPPPSQYPQQAPSYYPPYPSVQSYPYSAPPGAPGQQYGPRLDQPASVPPSAAPYNPAAAPLYGPPAYASRTNTYPAPASAPGTYPAHPYPPPTTQGHYPAGPILGAIPAPYSHGPAATSSGNSGSVGQKPHTTRSQNHSRGGQGKHSHDRKGNRFNNAKHQGQRQKHQQHMQRAGSALSERSGSFSSNAHENAVGDHKSTDNHQVADPQSRPQSSASKKSESVALSHGKKRGRAETGPASTEAATAKKARKSMDSVDPWAPKAGGSEEPEEDPIEKRLRELGVTGQAKPVETRPGFYPIYKPAVSNQESREQSLTNDERSTSPNTLPQPPQHHNEPQDDEDRPAAKRRSPSILPTQDDVDKNGSPPFRVHPHDKRKDSDKSPASPQEDEASDGSLTPVEAELLGYSSNIKEPAGSSDIREQDTPRRRRPRPPPVDSAYSRRW